jgi:hypothetical protein
MRFVIVFMISAFGFVSCNNSEKVAGVNRELNTVLQHYSDDSLKYKAANFLIQNMQGLQSQTVQLLWPDGKKYETDGCASTVTLAIDSLNLFYDRAYQNDFDNISANYLISNIDQAFDAWQISPWEKTISFIEFCEYLLPYRIGSEKLEEWRKISRNNFSWASDSIAKGASLIKIAGLINDSLKSMFTYGNSHFKGDNSISLSELICHSSGGCEAMANMAMFSMRAFGIPIMKDFTPVWASANGGHSWNSLYLETGELCSFMGCESRPRLHELNYYFPFDSNHKKLNNREYHRSAKIFRQVHSIQENELLRIIKKVEDVPSFFRKSSRTLDVTEEYIPVGDIKIDVNGPDKLRVLYLCVYNTGKWVPVQWAKTDQDKIVFENMGKDIVYLVGSFEQGQIKPLTSPFLFSEHDEISFLVPDFHDRVNISLNQASYSHPNYPIKKDSRYTLYYWNNHKWNVYSTKKAFGNNLGFEGLPRSGLYRLDEVGGVGEERPFIIFNQQPKWY